MKYIILLISVFAVLSFTGCENDNNSINGPDSLEKVTIGNTGVNTQQLTAGQSIDAGTVTYNDIDSDGDGAVDALEVCYNTTNGWELQEIHFWIGSSISDFPTTKSGNPKVGLFPYKSGDITGETSYCFTIPFYDLGFSCPGPEDYYVAAHASVRKDNGGGSYQTETGWGDGDRIKERGNWAMFTYITIACDGTPPPPVESSCETAFAFDGDDAGCFQNYEEYLDNSMRWGWTNGAYGEGTYSFDIYAGAGLCDYSSKGTLVGTLDVVYSGGTATVTYNISGTNPTTGLAYTLEEVHLYVGNDEFATKNGDFTLAPGQYPNKASELADGTISYTFTVNNLTGDIYVVAHAVVCGFPK
ncbi:MAG: hypothetical protein WBG58_19190 [Ignavibacteriaceae bacterium]